MSSPRPTVIAILIAGTTLFGGCGGSGHAGADGMGTGIGSGASTGSTGAIRVNQGVGTVAGDPPGVTGAGNLVFINHSANSTVTVAITNPNQEIPQSAVGSVINLDIYKQVQTTAYRIDYVLVSSMSFTIDFGTPVDDIPEGTTIVSTTLPDPAPGEFLSFSAAWNAAPPAIPPWIAN